MSRLVIIASAPCLPHDHIAEIGEGCTFKSAADFLATLGEWITNIYGADKLASVDWHLEVTH